MYTVCTRSLVHFHIAWILKNMDKSSWTYSIKGKPIWFVLSTLYLCRKVGYVSFPTWIFEKERKADGRITTFQPYLPSLCYVDSSELHNMYHDKVKVFLTIYLIPIWKGRVRIFFYLHIWKGKQIVVVE